MRSPNSEDYAELRQLMIEQIDELDPDRSAALALSGGVDSATLLFAMLESGRRPRCFTFYVEGVVSNDLVASRRLAQHFGVELVECMIPCDLDKVMDDCRTLVPLAAVVKQTVIQCMHPWLYLCPALQAYGHDKVITGLGADDLYCTQRKVQVLLHTKGEQAVVDAGYRQLYAAHMGFSTGNIIAMSRARYGIDVLDAYSQPRIHAWFLQFTIESLHRPHEKSASLFAFKDYFTRGAFRRLRDPYQAGSGLKALHEALLVRPDLNVRRMKSPISIYNDIKMGRV